jgi:[acyl-carrier-protein] S-malonyltransferase
MKLGILMSGQGAQKVDMGLDLYNTVGTYRETIDNASRVLGYDLQTEVCGREGRIFQTEFSQPAILAMSLGIYASLNDVMPKPVAALGLSLGEYSALTAAGVFSFEQSVKIIQDRGRIMQAASEQIPGKMAAAMTDDQELVTTILTDLQKNGLRVYPANYNTFNQLVIGGEDEALDIAINVLSEAGVSRIVPLDVAGAFHTPLMSVASAEMALRLDDESVCASTIPVYSNTTGQVFTNVKETLVKQMVTPTYFAQALTAMVDGGVDTLIEFGPSDTLTKFAKKIVGKEIRRYSVTDLASFEAVRSMLEEEDAIML